MWREKSKDRKTTQERVGRARPKDEKGAVFLLFGFNYGLRNGVKIGKGLAPQSEEGKKRAVSAGILRGTGQSIRSPEGICSGKRREVAGKEEKGERPALKGKISAEESSSGHNGGRPAVTS